MFKNKKYLKEEPVLLGKIENDEFYAIYDIGNYYIAKALGKDKEIFLHSLDGYETIQECRKKFKKIKEEKNGI